MPTGRKHGRFRHGHASDADHGQRHSREYRAWSQAKVRCYNPRRALYPNYGGRGIFMAKVWLDDFAAFLRDMGSCPPGHSLDRINNDGPYSPDNCRWATSTEQNRNSRHTKFLTIGNETKCLSEWADLLGLNRHTVYTRVQRGWSTLNALRPARPIGSRSFVPPKRMIPLARWLDRERGA